MRLQAARATFTGRLFTILVSAKPACKLIPCVSVLTRDAVRHDPLRFVSLFNSLIQRLQHTRIDRGDHLDGSIQLFFGHPRFPCVRKAAVHSGIAEPHHRDGKTDEHLLALGETLDGVSVTIKSSKVRFLGCHD